MLIQEVDTVYTCTSLLRQESRRVFNSVGEDERIFIIKGICESIRDCERHVKGSTGECKGS